MAAYFSTTRLRNWSRGSSISAAPATGAGRGRRGLPAPEPPPRPGPDQQNRTPGRVRRRAWRVTAGRFLNASRASSPLNSRSKIRPHRGVCHSQPRAPLVTAASSATRREHDVIHRHGSRRAESRWSARSPRSEGCARDRGPPDDHPASRVRHQHMCRTGSAAVSCAAGRR